MRPGTDPSLPTTLVFILVLALSVLALRFIARHLAPLLLRAVREIYNRIFGLSRGRFGIRLRESMARRAPRVTSLLERRLSAERFTGLPLTLLIAVALYAAFLVIELTLELVFEPAELARADELIEARLQLFRTPVLVAAFAWITNLGNTATLMAMATLASAFALSGGRAANVLPLWVTVIGVEVFTWAGKHALDRQRPEFLTDVIAHSPSFPSGHASGSLAIYGFIAYMLVRQIGSPARRFEVAFWIAVVIGLIGFSRIFLHVHHASDVAAGYLVGGFWLVIGIAVAELRRSRTDSDR
ncbi:MAG: phosphatase PAP2 family protein [Gammaproteobacteria bacterium]